MRTANVPKHILAGIPEPQLRPFLVVLSFNFWVGELLKIELSRLDGRLAHWQNLMNQPDGFEIHRNLVFDGGGKPALWLSSIAEPTFAITRSATSSCMTELTTRGQ